MKRRYKSGDWFQIGLGSARQAVGIITHAERSRLFGYFFTAASKGAAEPDALRLLRAEDAVHAGYFGGRPLEEARWEIVATSLPFDRAAWPFPQEPSPRYAGAREVEALLLALAGGRSRPHPFVVCNLRSPFSPEKLQPLERGGRAQCGNDATLADLAALGAFLSLHPEVEVSVRAGQPFDLRDLRALPSVRRLSLHAPLLHGADALERLEALEHLRVESCSAPLHLGRLDRLPRLRSLDLRGAFSGLQGLYDAEALESLSLAGTAEVDFARLQSAQRLRRVRLAFGRYAVEPQVLPALESLLLDAVPMRALPRLDRSASLLHLAIRRLADVTDLSPIAAAPALQRVEISGMPHLNVADFASLREMPRLESVFVEIGSRRKSREVYRLLSSGRSAVRRTGRGA